MYAELAALPYSAMAMDKVRIRLRFLVSNKIYFAHGNFAYENYQGHSEFNVAMDKTPHLARSKGVL